MKAIPLATLPKGEFIRLASRESGPVWIKGEYDRATKSFTLTRADDTNDWIFRKGSTLVFVGFTY
jgi:hypothetical protein